MDEENIAKSVLKDTDVLKETEKLLSETRLLELQIYKFWKYRRRVAKLNISSRGAKKTKERKDNHFKRILAVLKKVKIFEILTSIVEEKLTPKSGETPKSIASLSDIIEQIIDTRVQLNEVFSLLRVSAADDFMASRDFKAISEHYDNSVVSWKNSCLFLEENLEQEREDLNISSKTSEFIPEKLVEAVSILSQKNNNNSNPESKCQIEIICQEISDYISGKTPDLNNLLVAYSKLITFIENKSIKGISFNAAIKNAITFLGIYILRELGQKSNSVSPKIECIKLDFVEKYGIKEDPLMPLYAAIRKVKSGSLMRNIDIANEITEMFLEIFGRELTSAQLAELGPIPYPTKTASGTVEPENTNDNKRRKYTRKITGDIRIDISELKINPSSDWKEIMQQIIRLFIVLSDTLYDIWVAENCIPDMSHSDNFVRLTNTAIMLDNIISYTVTFIPGFDEDLKAARGRFHHLIRITNLNHLWALSPNSPIGDNGNIYRDALDLRDISVSDVKMPKFKIKDNEVDWLDIISDILSCMFSLMKQLQNTIQVERDEDSTEMPDMSNNYYFKTILEIVELFYQIIDEVVVSKTDFNEKLQQFKTALDDMSKATQKDVKVLEYKPASTFP